MKKLLSFLILLISFTSIACNTEKDNESDYQPSNEGVIKSKEYNQIDSLFQEIHEVDNFNGNVLISKKGEIIFKKSYGYAKYEGEPLSDNSIFNLASITKQFTAAAIVLLEREDKLSYDDDIRVYLPELNFYPKITVRNLLNHTSGLFDYMQLADSLILQKDDKALLNNNSVIDLYKNYKPKLNFLPNEKYEYSNTGYLLLATLIERISNDSYSNFLKNNIFEPLKMDHTKVLFRYINPVVLKNLTVGYEENDDGELVDAALTSPRVQNYDGVKGQGRLYSTTIDLNTWSNALSNNFFSKSELDAIYRTSKTTNNEQVNYGFGWYITTDLVNGKSVYHSGGWPGYLTYIEKNLKNDITKEFALKTMPYFENGKLIPIIDCVYSFEQITQAHERMQANANIGKIILQVAD